jgi:hypothetical protein
MTCNKTEALINSKQRKFQEPIPDGSMLNSARPLRTNTDDP